MKARVGLYQFKNMAKNLKVRHRIILEVISLQQDKVILLYQVRGNCMSLLYKYIDVNRTKWLSEVPTAYLAPLS
jgi:hypothetical protein